MAMTILVVDDSVTMLMSLETTLTMNGYQVETANNGKLALEKLKAGIKPNLILTDINMPLHSDLDVNHGERNLQT